MYLFKLEIFSLGRFLDVDYWFIWYFCFKFFEEPPCFKVEGSPWWIALPGGPGVLLCSSLCCVTVVDTHSLYIFFSHWFVITWDFPSLPLPFLILMYSFWLEIQEKFRKLLSKLNLPSLISPLGRQEGEQVFSSRCWGLIIKQGYNIRFSLIPEFSNEFPWWRSCNDFLNVILFLFFKDLAWNVIAFWIEEEISCLFGTNAFVF